MYCPICDKKLITDYCSNCGFDSTSCVELYPTFFFPAARSSIVKYRREWEMTLPSSPITSGTAPLSITWKADDSGCLTIYGDGEIPDRFCSYLGDLKSKVKTLQFADRITHIGNYAFEGFSLLTDVKIPDSAVSIGSWAFSGCESLVTISISEQVRNIGEWAFNGCKSLARISIPHGITSIKRGTFSDCRNQTCAVIPKSVICIEDYAFSSCSSLTSITIPESVVQIGWFAFTGCYKLKEINYGGSERTWNENSFYNCFENKVLIHCEKAARSHSYMSYNRFL